MRACEIHRAFGLENLVAVERPALEPGPGEIVISCRAVSLNYRDLLMIKGLYNPRQRLPLVPMSDGVGIVAKTGLGVRKVKEGDRVNSLFFQGWAAGRPTREKMATTLGGPLDGMLAEEVLVSEDGVAPALANLSDEEVSTLPCAALTAWNALVTRGGLKAGDTVLVQGTGGVSMFALQFSKLLGARVIVTSSRDDKLVRAKALGADELINYRSDPEWGVTARKMTGGVGVDHVVEVGGAGTFDQSLRALAPGGTISLIGVLSGATPTINLTPILMQNARVHGILVGTGEAFGEMTRAIGLAGLKPVIDRVFPFEEARQAFEYLESGSHFGKVCIRVQA